MCDFRSKNRVLGRGLEELNRRKQAAGHGDSLMKAIYLAGYRYEGLRRQLRSIQFVCERYDWWVRHSKGSVRVVRVRLGATANNVRITTVCSSQFSVEAAMTA